MTTAQKIIKYMAIAFAMFLIVTIFSIIIGTLYGLIGILGLKQNKEELQLGEVVSTNFEGSNIEKIDIEIAYTNLIIKQGESLKVETDNEKIKITEKDEVLKLEEKNINWFSKNEMGDLIIYIPQNFEFEKIEINAGAGKVTIDNLLTKKLYFELGAGETKINDVKVTDEAEIDGGAGKLEISEGIINNLDLDLGVGEVNLEVELTGNNEINAGVGSLKLNLNGNKENYSIKTDKGIGAIKIDGKEVSSGEKIGNGKNSIEIDGGIGNINIDFD